MPGFYTSYTFNFYPGSIEVRETCFGPRIVIYPYTNLKDGAFILKGYSYQEYIQELLLKAENPKPQRNLK